MIEEYNLKLLCDKYGVSADNIVNKNNNILSKGEYEDIDKTLDYLINELKVNKKNIEKCPSILYRNVNAIKDNIDFLKQNNVSFSTIESCLHVLSSEPNSLKDTYDYVEENYGVESINKTTSILACDKDLLIEIEGVGLNKDWNLTIAVSVKFGFNTLDEVKNLLNSEEYKLYPDLFTSEVLAHAKIEDIKKMIQSKEFKEHPDLFTSEVLARAKIEEIQKMIQSKEFKEHPDLFTSTTLAHARIEDIQKMIQSKEFKEHLDLFTSTTLAHAKIEDIQKMINSKEFKEHPDLFTSEVLAHAKIEEIQKMINSKEFKEHPDLFTSQTLARAKIEEIQKMINSKEFKEHPDLFTSTTLAYAKIEEIQKMIQSKEFEEHPDLFTSTTLAHAKIEEIQKMINSKEFKEHPDLFTSTTLARAKIEDIQKLLEMPYWNDARYKDLLTSSVVAKSKQMITKLPVLIRMAEYYKIDGYLTTTFLILSPSQNFALINYLNDNNMPLIENDKLNMVFGKQPGVLKKKYGIDIKEQMLKYDFSKFSFDEDTKKGGSKNAVR